ncbi:MAG: site-specific integrase [Desulfobacterales bacterium]
MQTSCDALLDRYLDFLMVEKGLAAQTIEAYSRDLVRYISFLDENFSEKYSINFSGFIFYFNKI